MSTLAMPQSRKKALTAASSPASAPVCERARASPRRERPSLYATTGLPAACAFRAAAERRTASRTVSRNRRMTRVDGSSARISTSSATPRSASFPTDTSLEKPRPRASPRDRSVPSMVPLCDTKLVVPAGKDSISRTAFAESATRPGTSMRPMLLGPSSRTPSARARAASRPWRAAPLLPASAKPPASTVTTFTPRAPQSSSAPSTDSLGVRMYAWSISPGASARLFQARSPSTSARAAFTGTMRPE